MGQWTHSRPSSEVLRSSQAARFQSESASFHSYSLAQELRIESFRELDTLSVDGNRPGKNVASWLDGRVSSKFMDSATAQVTPLELTQKLMEAAISAGAEYKEAIVDGVSIINGVVQGVSIAGEGVLPTDKVVICAGPWSGVMVEDFFGIPMPMEGIKSTSLVYSDIEAVRREPFACFCAEDANGCHLELYPRPNGDICE